MNAKVVLIALVAAAAGAGLTFVLTEGGDRESRRSERAAVDLHRRLEAAKAERDKARAELARRRHEPDTRVVSTPAIPKAGAEAVEIPPDPEARKRRVAELRAQMDGWFEKGDGAAALAALKELSQLNPEGFPLAAELYMRVEEDLGADSKLGHTKWVHISPSFDDRGLHGLMTWALEHTDVHEDFRNAAALQLPWIQERGVTEKQYLRLLQTEQDSYVLSTLADGLSLLATEKARRGLLDTIIDQRHKPELRLVVARELADPDHGSWARATVVKLVVTEPDERVRAVLRAALLAYDPPASGAIVLEAGEHARRAGYRVGDIITRYGGRPVRSGNDLVGARNAHLKERRSIEVVVVRAGSEVTLRVPPSYLGLSTRTVEAR
ncbi:MAG: hypothetical protein ACE10D_10900 [Planctomycetota bacterium]